VVRVFSAPPDVYPWTVFQGRLIAYSIPILYKDDSLLAVDKPAGMEVEGELAELVRTRYKTARPCTGWTRTPPGSPFSRWTISRTRRSFPPWKTARWKNFTAAS
jgi:hypothetical protein